MTYREAIVSGEKSLCEAGIADARNDAWLLLTLSLIHISEPTRRS